MPLFNRIFNNSNSHLSHAIFKNNGSNENLHKETLKNSAEDKNFNTNHKIVKENVTVNDLLSNQSQQTSSNNINIPSQGNKPEAYADGLKSSHSRDQLKHHNHHGKSGFWAWANYTSTTVIHLKHHLFIHMHFLMTMPRISLLHITPHQWLRSKDSLDPNCSAAVQRTLSTATRKIDT